METLIDTGRSNYYDIQRQKHSKQIVRDVPHYPGDLLVMTGDFQKEFTHEIPVQKKITTPRVSLTFRMHK